MIWRYQPTEEEKALMRLAHELELVYGWLEAAEQRLHLTAIAVGGLAFLAGIGVCWLWLVR